MAWLSRNRDVEIRQTVELPALDEEQLKRFRKVLGIHFVTAGRVNMVEASEPLTLRQVRKLTSAVGFCRRLEEDNRRYESAEVFAAFEERLEQQALRMRIEGKKVGAIKDLEYEQDIGAFQRRMATYSVIAAACSAVAAIGSLAVAALQLAHTK